MMRRNRAQANLDEPLGYSILHDSSERAGMREIVALKALVEVRVGIELDDAQRL